MNEKLGLQNETGGRTETQNTYKYIYNWLKCHYECVFVVLSDWKCSYDAPPAICKRTLTVECTFTLTWVKRDELFKHLSKQNSFEWCPHVLLCHLLMWSRHNQLTLFLSAEDGSVSPSGTRYYQPLVVWPAGVSLPGSFICGRCLGICTQARSTGADWWPWWCLFFIIR